MSRDRRALLGARSPTTSASSKGNWGVDTKARHLRRSSSFTFNKRLGGQGSLFVPVNIRLNKASPAYYYMFICSVGVGILRDNRPSLKYIGTFRHRVRVKGNRGNWQFHGLNSGLGPKPADS